MGILGYFRQKGGSHPIHRDFIKKKTENILEFFAKRGGGHYGPEWRNISKAYECAFGSEVAETTERTQAISQENVFLKPICEQNSIV